PGAGRVQLPALAPFAADRAVLAGELGTGAGGDAARAVLPGHTGRHHSWRAVLRLARRRVAGRAGARRRARPVRDSRTRYPTAAHWARDAGAGARVVAPMEALAWLISTSR